MPVDAYSQCPGGTGKKVKFCCPDLVGELERIQRMFQGEQFQACLEFVNRLEEKNPGRACLLATKAVLLRVLDRPEEAKANAAAFLEHHPENPIAWAETANVKALLEGGEAAMEALQKALGASRGDMLSPVYEMLGTVGGLLALDGEFLSARAVYSLQAVLNPQDGHPRQVLHELNTSPAVPLWVKEVRNLLPCPDGSPFKQEFDDALTMAYRAQWSAAGAAFVALAARAGDLPAIWHNVMLVRGYAADRAGCIEAARKYASLDLPLEDAAELEALAVFLSEDGLGDQADVYRLEYPVTNVDELHIAFSSARHVGTMEVDAASWEGVQPPPKTVYAVFDRVAPASAADLTLENVPQLLCRAFLFGRQTDREPQLVVEDVFCDQLALVKERLAELGGACLGPISSERVADQTSRTVHLLRREWRPPAGATRDQLRRMAAQYHRDFVLEQWPKMPLGLLGGKTVQEAAADDGLRRRALAAVLLLEFWIERLGIDFDGNDLRARLDLPTRYPIDPATTSPDSVPLTRLDRLIVEKLTDQQLLDAYRVAIALGATTALRKFSLAIVARPSTTGRPERLGALSMAVQMEQERAPDQALAHIEEGRQVFVAKGQSCAHWDLMELFLRFRTGQMDEAERVYRHLEYRHMQEPGVPQALGEFLMAIGAIRPDGTPGAPPPQEPAIVVPGGGEAGKLWTPDSAPAPGEKPKLWTPGTE